LPWATSSTVSVCSVGSTFAPTAHRALLAHNYSVTWYGTRSKRSSKVRAEGLDPDDPAVVAAIDLVRWQLSVCRVTRASESSKNGSGPRRWPSQERCKSGLT